MDFATAYSLHTTTLDADLARLRAMILDPRHLNPDSGEIKLVRESLQKTTDSIFALKEAQAEAERLQAAAALHQSTTPDPQADIPVH